MIFADTGAFVGRYLTRDQHHDEAAGLWSKVRTDGQRCLTTSLVLSETVTLLARRAGPPFAVEKARLILASPTFDVIRPTKRDESDALNWLERFSDQDLSFTDAVSFAVMRRRRIRAAFTFDHHFELAGFSLYR